MGAYQRIRQKPLKTRPTRLPPIQTGDPIIIGKVPRTRLERLFLAGPRCHWCDRETLLTRSFAGGKLPKHAATIDHVYSRINPAWRGNRHRVVLACSSCNQQRSRDEAAILQAKKRMPRRYEVIRLIAQSIEAALRHSEGKVK